MTPPDICIYHGPNCLDGFAAAWAIKSRWPDCECVPAQYGDIPPPVIDKHVLIVDFSYPAEILEALAKITASITVLDHHKTAQAELEPLLEARVIQGKFDMDKSGARLAWEYAWGAGRECPVLLTHVEDRDLWRFKLDGTQEITAWMFSHPYDLAFFDKAVRLVENIGDRTAIMREGAAILRDRDTMVNELLAITTRQMVIGPYLVPVANMPYTMASQAAGQLAQGHPFAATYFDRADGSRVFSLRRRDGDVDVSEIAKLYGGGGHAAAAGFTAETGWEGHDPDALAYDALWALGFDDVQETSEPQSIPLQADAKSKVKA